MYGICFEFCRIMKNDIIFIGGIHGVGKGTLCKRIESELGIIHLSASEVLKWKDFNVDSSDKRVSDIDSTQDCLLKNLKGVITPGKTYLLDGHFCLLNKESKIEKVPEEVFIGINPKKIIVLSETPEIIAKRLYQRDGKRYETSLLEKMQNTEIEHAQYLSSLLDLEMFEVQSDSYNTLKEVINN